MTYEPHNDEHTIRELSQFGFTEASRETAPDGGVAITFNYPDSHSRIKPLTVTLRGPQDELNENDRNKIAAAVAIVRGAMRTSPQQRRDFSEYEPIKNKPSLSPQKKVTLVLDACALFPLFRAPREEFKPHAQSWGDIIPAIADCDAVERIVIPSAIADWECGQRIRNSQGHWEAIENPDNRSHKAMQALFATASRYTIDKDGNWRQMYKGSNPNLVITETDLDTRLFRTIEDACKKHKDHGGKINANFLSELRHSESVQHQGEASMYWVANQLPIASQSCTNNISNVYLVSNDTSSLSAHSFKRTSAAHPLVGAVTLKGLLDAFIGDPASPTHAFIASRLSEQFDIPVGELSLDRIHDDMVEHDVTGHAHGLYMSSSIGECERPIDLDGKYGPSLKALISGERKVAEGENIPRPTNGYTGHVSKRHGKHFGGLY